MLPSDGTCGEAVARRAVARRAVVRRALCLVVFGVNSSGVGARWWDRRGRGRRRSRGLLRVCQRVVRWTGCCRRIRRGWPGRSRSPDAGRAVVPQPAQRQGRAVAQVPADVREHASVAHVDSSQGGPAGLGVLGQALPQADLGRLGWWFGHDLDPAPPTGGVSPPRLGAGSGRTCPHVDPPYRSGQDGAASADRRGLRGRRRQRRRCPGSGRVRGHGTQMASPLRAAAVGRAGRRAPPGPAPTFQRRAARAGHRDRLRAARVSNTNTIAAERWPTWRPGTCTAARSSVAANRPPVSPRSADSPSRS
jgi:hypothetical protein